MLKIKNGRIWDIVRKKWVLTKPEEIIRQQTLQYLHFEKKYPLSLIVVEKELVFNGLKKRFDILVYDKNLNPYILVECKNASIELNHQTTHQIVSYTLALEPKYIILSNGIKWLVFFRNNAQIEAIEEIPAFEL